MKNIHHNSSEYNPIFVGGAGRSGTTLLRVMLNSHPKLYSGPEFKMLPQVIELYNQFNHSAFQPIADSYLLNNENIKSNFRKFIYNFFEPIQKESGAKRIVEKSPHNVLIAKELAEIFPKAKFIHVVRDGRDVASSLREMNWTDFNGKSLWYVENLENATKYWEEIITKGIEDAKDPNLVGKLKFVKYEELINNPEKVLRNVINFLGEDWDPIMLEYYNFERNEKQVESSTDQVSNKLYTKSMKRWEQEFTKNDKDVFKSVAGSLLIQLGYENSFEW